MAPTLGWLGFAITIEAYYRLKGHGATREQFWNSFQEFARGWQGCLWRKNGT